MGIEVGFLGTLGYKTKFYWLELVCEKDKKM